MDSGTREYLKTHQAGHFRANEAPWRRIGLFQYRVLESGVATQNRLSVIESLLPPHGKGPMFHFHEMHDEAFYVTRGSVRFHCPGRPDMDAKPGDMVTIPIRIPHKFTNPFDEEACMVSIFTPGHYVRYFEYLEELIGEGKELTEEVNRVAMAKFATIPLNDGDLVDL